MSTIEDILVRLNQLTEEVRKLKSLSPQDDINSPSTLEITALGLIAEQIKRYIKTQHTKAGDKYICHTVLDETTGAASIQITWLDALKDDDSYSTASFCAALANEHRIKILKALSNQEKSTAELTGLIGLEGGPLYHHIKELIKARFVHQKGRSCYQITREGLDALLTVGALNRRNTWGLKEEVWQKGDTDEN